MSRNYKFPAPARLHRVANLNSINYPRILAKLIDYDANGNQKEITRRISDPEQPLGHREETLRRNLWDSEDRLRAVDLNPEADTDKPLVAAYTYDAAGERTIKYVPGRFDARYSAKETGKAERLEAMLYPSPLLTVKTLPIPEGVSREELERLALTKYTNHYYTSTELSTGIGSERIASALGTLTQLGILCEQTGDPGQAMINRMDKKVDGAGTALKMDHTRLGKTLQLPPPFHYKGQWLTCDLTVYPDMYAAFWYHPDHLGSSSYITNLAGEITQHMEYLPFGETLVEEHLNNNNSPYKFNAKELDAETGLYYYEQRYYDGNKSTFLGVDPLAEKALGWTPYRYSFNNPITFVDPNGLFETKSEAKQWAKDNNIRTGWFSRHIVEQGANGAWEINNRKEGLSYFRDSSLDGVDVVGRREDGVIESALAVGKKRDGGVNSIDSGVDAISGASAPFPLMPQEGYVWEEGMPSLFTNGETTLVVSSGTGEYIDLMSKQLEREFNCKHK